jgi:hypothetical protein
MKDPYPYSIAARNVPVPWCVCLSVLGVVVCRAHGHVHIPRHPLFDLMDVYTSGMDGGRT